MPVDSLILRTAGLKDCQVCYLLHCFLAFILTVLFAKDSDLAVKTSSNTLHIYPRVLEALEARGFPVKLMLERRDRDMSLMVRKSVLLS